MIILVYVAGPLFTQAEREYNEQLATLCESHGYRTFLPQRDGGLLKDDVAAQQIFEMDKKNIEDAHLIVANLDGADVDSGTAWEIGYAIAQGKKVIGIRTDFRTLTSIARINPMIEQSVQLVTSVNELKEVLLSVISNA